MKAEEDSAFCQDTEGQRTVIPGRCFPQPPSVSHQGQVSEHPIPQGQAQDASAGASQPPSAMARAAQGPLAPGRAEAG